MPSPQVEAPPKPHSSRFTSAVKALIRARITAGLITILPIVLTLWLVKVVFGWLRDASLWAVDAFLLSSLGRGMLEAWHVDSAKLESAGLEALPPGLRWGIPIFSVLLTFFLLYVIGMIMTNVLGQRLLDLVEYVVDRLPFVKTIYHTLKQVLKLFSGDQSKGFQRVALVPFPNEITRSVGFITNTMRDAVTGEELCAVFIATTPNPTTGFVFVLRRSDITEVDWSVEDAVKVIMSGGILSPAYVTMTTNGPAAAQAGPAPLPKPPAE